MKTPVSLKLISVVIIIVTLAGFALLGLIGITGARTALSIHVGQVTTNVSGAAETITVPVSLTNPGPLSLNGISLKIIISDVNGSQISNGGGGPLSLSAGQSGQLPISIPFDLSQLSQANLQELAVTSQNLTLKATLNASVSRITSFQAAINIPYQWGAPLSNFTFGTAALSAYNSTYAKLNLPFSFIDQSQFLAVQGTVSGTISGQSGQAYGVISSQSINVNTETIFSGQLSGYVSLSAPQTGLVAHLQFQTTFGTFSEDISIA